MEERIRRFRELTSQLLSERRGLRGWYPEELQEEAIGCAQAAVAQGQSVRGVAAALGVSHGTLYRWLEKRGGQLRKVEVVQSEVVRCERSSNLVLVTPQGYRVEGLGVGDVARLLEVLR
jgi:DNA invertase Pin-like site-specific DNA recombinase